MSAANSVLECGGKAKICIMCICFPSAGCHSTIEDAGFQVVLVDKSAFCGGNSTKAERGLMAAVPRDRRARSRLIAPVSGEATSGINGAETMTQKATSPPCSV